MNSKEFKNLSEGEIVTVSMNSKETGKLFKVIKIGRLDENFYRDNQILVELLEGELEEVNSCDSKSMIVSKSKRWYRYQAIKRV